MVTGSLTLDQLSLRGPIAPREAIDLVGELLVVVAEHHARGQTVGPLYPTSVRLGPAGLEVVGGRVERADALEMPDYTPPEQLTGAPWDPGADLFAMGAILGDLLAGRRLQDGGAGALFGRVSGAPMAVPAAVRGQPLGAFIQRATAVTRGERFGGVLEMARSLEQILGGLPVSAPVSVARTPSPQPPLDPPLRELAPTPRPPRPRRAPPASERVLFVVGGGWPWAVGAAMALSGICLMLWAFR